MFEVPQLFMRFRIFGQYIPTSLAVLALIEALLCFLAVYAAVFIRFQIGFKRLPQFVDEFGPLWPRGLAFSAIVVTCLLAFGLYNSRQRTQLSGVLARLLLALLVSACAIAALFYAFPSRHLLRGVEALMVILAVCGVLTLRLVFLHQGRRKP
jgi:FlaA1/EpsC-like NDP-sugar epimerase